VSKEGVILYVISFLGFINITIAVFLFAIVMNGYALYADEIDGNAILASQKFYVKLHF